MKALYQHVLLNSFYLWFDNFLLKKGRAYKNYRTDFYYYADERIQNKVVFGSPYKQWVYDKNISNSIINPVISGDSGAIAEGTSGLTFDFDNGRILFDSDFDTGNNISGGFTVKDFKQEINKDPNNPDITT